MHMVKPKGYVESRVPGQGEWKMQITKWERTFGPRRLVTQLRRGKEVWCSRKKFMYFKQLI